MPGAQQLLSNWRLLILSRKDSLVFRRHSILQGHTEGAREGRVSMRAATDTSDLTTLPHQRHLFSLFCHSRLGSFHRPRCLPLCTDRPPGLLWTRPGAEGSANTSEREAVMNVKETREDFTGQRGFCSLLILEARLQNAFESSFKRPVHRAAPGKMKQNSC